MILVLLMVVNKVVHQLINGRSLPCRPILPPRRIHFHSFHQGSPDTLGVGHFLQASYHRLRTLLDKDPRSSLVSGSRPPEARLQKIMNLWLTMDRSTLYLLLAMAFLTWDLTMSSQYTLCDLFCEPRALITYNRRWLKSGYVRKVAWILLRSASTLSEDWTFLPLWAVRIESCLVFHGKARAGQLCVDVVMKSNFFLQTTARHVAKRCSTSSLSCDADTTTGYWSDNVTQVCIDPINIAYKSPSLRILGTVDIFPWRRRKTDNHSDGGRRKSQD